MRISISAILYLSVCKCNAINVDTTDVVFPLGSVGLASAGSVSVKIKVDKTKTNLNELFPRSVIFLTPEQERLYWVTSADSAVLDVDRPSFARRYISGYGETNLVVDGRYDSPTLLNAYLHNPRTNRTSKTVSRVNRRTSDGIWSWLFSADENAQGGENNEELVPQRFLGRIEVEVTQKDGSHLEYQFRYLPDAQGILSLGFIVLIGIYEGMMLTVWRSAVTQLHVVFVFAGIMLSGYLYLAASGAAALQEDANTSVWRYRYLPEYGGKIFDAAEMAVFLLTALGYKIIRRSMTRPEWRLVTILVLVMIYVGFFEVGCEDSEEGCGGYRLTRVIVSSLAFLVVIVGANFHLATLSAQVPESALNTVGRLYQKREAYGKFRNIFLLYIIHPSLVIYYRLSVLDWTDDWAFVVFFWLLRGGILLAVLWTFRPQVTDMKVFDLVAFRQ